MNPVTYKGHEIDVKFDGYADDADGKPGRRLKIFVDGEAIGTCIPILGGEGPAFKFGQHYIDKMDGPEKRPENIEFRLEFDVEALRKLFEDSGGKP